MKIAQLTELIGLKAETGMNFLFIEDIDTSKDGMFFQISEFERPSDSATSPLNFLKFSGFLINNFFEPSVLIGSKKFENLQNQNKFYKVIGMEVSSKYKWMQI